MQAARNRLINATAGAVDMLEDLAATAESETVRLGAINSMLDRAGIRGGIEVEQKVDVTINESAEIVKKRLAQLRKGQEDRAVLMKKLTEGVPADVVDAEVVDDE